MTDILKEAREAIAGQGFDPDEVISMVGLGHDWKNLLAFFIKKEVKPQHYSDVAFLLDHDKASSYVERNSIPAKEVYKVNRVYQWDFGQLEHLFEEDVPIETLGRLENIRGMMLEDDFLPSLKIDDSRFTLDEKSDEYEKYLEKLNRREVPKEMVRALKARLADFKDRIYNGALDSETQALYERIKGLPQFRRAKTNVVKSIALNSFFERRGYEKALKKGVPAVDFISFSEAYEKHGEAATTMYDTFGPFMLNYLTKAYDDNKDVFKEWMGKTKGFNRTIRALYLVYCSMFSDKGRAHLDQYLSKVPKGTQVKLFGLFNHDHFGPNMQLIDYGFEKRVIGYSSRMPTVQVTSDDIVSKVEDIIRKAHDYECKIRVKDLDLNDDCFRHAVLDKAGKAPLITSEDLAGIAERSSGHTRYLARMWAQNTEGLHGKTIELIAAQLRINENDLKKVIARAKDSESYDLEAVVAELEDFREMSGMEVDPKEFGLSKIVEGEFTVQPMNRRSGFFGIDNNFGARLILSPNREVLKELLEQRITISQHVENSIAYARFYPEGDTLRVEEIQTDIFDKELNVPSSFKKKYSSWAQMVILALEHFAIVAGYRRIAITPSEVQMRKWENWSGLRGVTAHNIYTKLPSENGYRLEITDITLGEMTSEQIPETLMWVKNLDKRSLNRYERLFYRSKKDVEVFEACKRISPPGKRKFDYSKRDMLHGRFDLFEDEKSCEAQS